MENSPVGFQSICIFMPTGKTFTFRDVNILIENESVLVFNYTAMSDHFVKTMTVYKPGVIGVSVMEAL